MKVLDDLANEVCSFKNPLLIIERFFLLVCESWMFALSLFCKLRYEKQKSQLLRISIIVWGYKYYLMYCDKKLLEKQLKKF